MQVIHYAVEDEVIAVTVESTGAGYQVTVGDRVYQVSVEEFKAGMLSLHLNDRPAIAFVASSGDERSIWMSGETYRISKVEARSRRRGGAGIADATGHLTAAMPGAVVSVAVSAGDRVERGAVLVVLEAMKMELQITAPVDGVIAAVHCREGQSVDRGELLVEMEKQDTGLGDWVTR